MNEIYTSDYELDLEYYIQDHGCDKVANAIRELIKLLYVKPESYQNRIQIGKTIKNKNDQLVIKGSSYRSIVNTHLTKNLISKDLKNRAIIVYKFLNKDLLGVNENRDIKEGIEKLLSEKRLPRTHKSPHPAGDLDKYKSVENILSKPNQIPTEQTLKFCIAILNIPLDILESIITGVDNEIILNDPSKPESNGKDNTPLLELQYQTDQNKKDIKTSKNLRRTLVVIAGIVTITVLLTYLFTSINYFPQTKNPNLINASELFLISRDITETLSKHEVQLQIISLIPTQDRSEVFDTEYPVNEVLIKFKIINNTNQYLFPDFVQINSQSEKFQIKNISIQNSLTDLQFTPVIFHINRNENSIQAPIINDSSFKNIKPLSVSIGSFLLQADPELQPYLISCNLTFSAHSDNNENFEISTNSHFDLLSIKN